jgi:hypothetical protein
VPGDEAAARLLFGPSRFVYDAGTLWIAARMLRDRTELRLPDDIRPLVEESYHPESRAELLALGGRKLVEAEERRAQELEAQRTKARACCIPPSSADPEGVVALDDDEDAVQAFTRDGQSATLLPFAWNDAGGRALWASSDAPVWALDAARDDAWRLASDLMDQTLSLPAPGVVEVKGIAGRHQRQWSTWLTRFSRFADESGLGRRAEPIPMMRVGEAYEGVLQMGKSQRAITYTPELGLVMEKRDEERER